MSHKTILSSIRDDDHLIEILDEAENRARLEFEREKVFRQAMTIVLAFCAGSIATVTLFMLMGTI